MSREPALLVVALDEERATASPGASGELEISWRLTRRGDLRDALDGGEAPYLVIVQQDEPLDTASLARTVAALECCSEAVLGTPGLLWRPPALGLDISTLQRDAGGGHLHEGRRLARLLALRAVTFPSWDAVVLRRAALGEDLPRRAERDQGAILTPAQLLGPLAVELLLRGSAWSGQHLGYARRSSCAARDDVEAWSRALPSAERLGVLDGEDRARARVALRREAERAGVGDVLASSAEQTPSKRPATPAASPASGPSPDVGSARAGREGIPATAARRNWPLQRFLIAAGDYDPGSAGLVALHMLCDRLNRQGYDATIAPFTALPGVPAHGITNPDFFTPLAKLGDRFEHTVAIYPEIVPGNPLGSPWVVRWLLNRPGKITGIEMHAGPNDLLVAWSDAVDAEVPVLNLPLTDLATYASDGRARRGRLLWVGKGRVPPSLDRSDMTEITRSWPRGRPAMAELLRSAKLLVSCDWLTSLSVESILCGTPVAFAGAQEWTPGMPMDLGPLLVPGTIACPDGQPSAEELSAAIAGCAEYRANYEESVRRIPETVDSFVALVNEHFDRVATRSLASASA